MQGTWTINGAEIVLRLAGAPAECADAARYTVAVDGHLTFALVNDTCIERRMILDRSEASGRRDGRRTRTSHRAHG